MNDDNAGLPAWMLCSDLLIKAKNELANEAILSLEREMKAGRIDVKGSVITQPDQQQEGENMLFVINNLVGERDGIHERYDQYIRDLEHDPSKFDGKTAERIESLKKFVLAVDEIYALMHYSAVMGEWADDVAMHVKEEKPLEILERTSEGHERADAAAFVLSLKSFAREKIFSEEERMLLEETSRAGSTAHKGHAHN